MTLDEQYFKAVARMVNCRSRERFEVYRRKVEDLYWQLAAEVVWDE